MPSLGLLLAVLAACPWMASAFRTSSVLLDEADNEADQLREKNVDFFVFYDLYDLVEMGPKGSGIAGSMAGSVAGSIAGSATGGVGSIPGSVAGSAVGGAVGGAVGVGSGLPTSHLESSSSAVSEGKVWRSASGFKLSAAEIRSVQGKFNLSAEALMASSRAFSHSEVVLCHASQFNHADLEYLTENLGKIVSETWVGERHRRRMSCWRLAYGGGACVQPGCGIAKHRFGFSDSASPPYGPRYRIPLGITSFQVSSYTLNPLNIIMKTIFKKADRWKGTDYSLANHNCNHFARFLVQCILNMEMPSRFKLGVNHKISSSSWALWFASIATSAVGGLMAGPIGIAAGPLLFLGMPDGSCK